jgi:amidase
MTADIVFATTKQLAAAIRTGQVSAAEVLEAHLAQIEERNPVLNAIVTLDAAGARKRAREADEAMTKGELWGPLHGVPFTLKDCHATAGMRTTAGYEPLADYIPEEDGTISERLKAAGGILLGKTNVPVLLADIQSDNPIFGRSNNPWRLERTPGGSSGGAAAALAAGMTPFDIGSDIGGSIRIPSHFCGLFGLKPTENRVSSAGHIPELPGLPRSVRIMASIGPMARSVEDLALLYQIISGPDGRDVEVPPVPVDQPPQVELKELRIALATTFPGFPVAAAITEALKEVAHELQPLCAAVEEAALPDEDLALAVARGRELTDMMVGAFGTEKKEPPVSLARYLEALHHRDHFIAAWEAFFEVWDVLLCPPSMVTAFPHCQVQSPLQVDGKSVDYWFANAHCKVFNYSGHPAVVLPYKVGGDGLPIGIQVVGRRWAEARLLAIASALAQVTGQFRRPPGY